MDPNTYCDSILKNIKASNLHYILNENPFSLKVTIRKKFIENRIPIPGESSNLEALQSEVNELKNSLQAQIRKVEEVEQENFKLKASLHEISDELVDTKADVSKNEEVSAEVVKLKSMNDNLKRLG